MDNTALYLHNYHCENLRSYLPHIWFEAFLGTIYNEFFSSNQLCQCIELGFNKTGFSSITGRWSVLSLHTIFKHSSRPSQPGLRGDGILLTIRSCPLFLMWSIINTVCIYNTHYMNLKCQAPNCHWYSWSPDKISLYNIFQNNSELSFIIHRNTTVMKTSFTSPVWNDFIGGIACYIFRLIEPSSGSVHW
jgi:hypothetical protein